MSAVDQLSAGSVLRRGDNLFIVEVSPDPSGDVVVGELGNRKVKAGRMFDLGDDCPLPTCDGEIVEGETAQRRHCSEGCLEWIRNCPADGDDCPSHSCDDGEAIVSIQNGKYERKCTECGTFGFGTVHWREAWWPGAKRETLDYLSERDGGDEDAE